MLASGMSEDEILSEYPYLGKVGFPPKYAYADRQEPDFTFAPSLGPCETVRAITSPEPAENTSQSLSGSRPQFPPCPPAINLQK